MVTYLSNISRTGPASLQWPVRAHELTLFASWRIQPAYNQKACYLPIQQNVRFVSSLELVPY